jgi:ATPase family associated with various cellular activities (AAA)
MSTNHTHTAQFDEPTIDALQKLSEKFDGMKYYFHENMGMWLFMEFGGNVPGAYFNHKSTPIALFPATAESEFCINDMTFHAVSFKNMFTADCDYGCTHLLPVIFAKSLEEYTALFTYLEKKHTPAPPSINGKIFFWKPSYGQYNESTFTVEQKTEDELVGLEDFFEMMENDISAIAENEAIARKLGASNGINYFAYGRPGTGKTSSIKAVAAKLGLPVYIASLADGGSASTMNAIMNPQNDAKLKIVVVEDFDRYIKNGSVVGSTHMSSLLNALEGVQDSFGTIRIFSANFPENALQDEALASRMTRFIEFKVPTHENFVRHLLNIYPGRNEEVEQLVTLFKKRDMTIRDANRYMSRFIVYENPLQEAIDRFNEYVEKMNELKKMRDGSSSGSNSDSDDGY